MRIHEFEGCFLLDAVTLASVPVHTPDCPSVAATHRRKKRAVEEETTPVWLTYS